jgi:lipopolysaccharide assembly protein B
MPTESAFFFAGLLFVSAALGYVFARLGQLDDEERRPTGLDYVRGLKYLLKEQPDRALEALTGAAEIDEDTLETHFALGQLFRRRGEIERAIRVHRDLIDRPNLKREYREQAQFELAQDYLSAGLFDRTESLLAGLRDSPRHGLEALRKLIRLSELTREWERAIKLHRELEEQDRTAVRSGTVSHYFCELSEQARQNGDLAGAAAWLEQAEQGRAETLRTMLSHAALESDRNNQGEAIRWLRRAAEREPSLLVEILPRFSAACRSVGREEEFGDFLRHLLRSDPQSGRAVALAAMLNPDIRDETAIACLWDFVAADAALLALVDGDRSGAVDALREKRQFLPRVRTALQAMATRGRSYRCMECGYLSATMQWQCPGCAAWDTVRPRVRLAFDSGDR